MNFSFRDANRHVHFAKDHYESFITQDRTLLDGTRRELEQYRLKVDSLSHDVRSFIFIEKQKSNSLNLVFSYVIQILNYLPKMNESMN